MEFLRSAVIVSFVLLVLAVLAFGREDAEFSRMIQRAQTARIQQQPPLYLELAERQIKSAERLYATDKLEEAPVEIHEAVIFADKASEAATRSGKHLKDTEITLRKMADKLRSMERPLTLVDQAPLKTAADHFETLRTNLLSHMFKGAK